jgi:hypothetical protein
MQQLDASAITPAALIQWLHTTADTLVDPTTGLRYDRLNLGRALEMLVGADEDGSTPEESRNLGWLAREVHVSGVFQTATDRDYFQFTASASGQVELSVTAPASVGAAWLSPEGGLDTRAHLTLPVVAGQTYVVGLASALQTIGRYSLALTLQPDANRPPATDLGTITQLLLPEVALAQGQAAFQFVASRTGRLTVELQAATGAPAAATLRVFDAHGPVATARGALATPAGQDAASAQASLRLDLDVVAGQSYRLEVESTALGAGLRLTNLVTFHEGLVVATGTAGSDRFVYQGGTEGWLKINEVRYELGNVAGVSIEASAGDDSLLVRGGSEAETIVLAPGLATSRSSLRHFMARGMREVRAVAQAEDEVQIFDSPTSDLVLAGPRGVQVMMPQGVLAAEGAGTYDIVAQAGGNDTARLVDSSGDDRLLVGPRKATLRAAGVTLRARGFAQIVVTATAGGNDRATLEGFPSSDQWRTTARAVAVYGPGYGVRLSGIELVQSEGNQEVLRPIAPTRFLGDDPPAGHEPLVLLSMPIVVGAFAGDEPLAAGALGQSAAPPPSVGDASLGRCSDDAGSQPELEAHLRRLEPWLAQLHAGQPPQIDLAAVDFLFQKLARPLSRTDPRSR